MSVTLKDIAEVSGVDVGSVSRTLRNHPRAMTLRPETRQRIIETAEKLGYCRNELAATIRTGLNRTVAVISAFSNMELPNYSSMVISGILMEATEQDYEIKIYSDENLELCYSKIMGAQIRNIISMSIDSVKRAEEARLSEKYKLNLIYVYEKAQGPYKTVVTANKQSACDAIAYFVKMGHERIAFLSGPLDGVYDQERYKGYRQALLDAGLTENPEFAISGQTIEEWTYGITKLLGMDIKLRPTAFFCTTDSTGFLVQKIALKNSLRIPEDISVIGFGNTNACAFAFSPLTSISESYTDLGKAAMRILFNNGNNYNIDSENSYKLPGKLIIRESVSALRKSKKPMLSAKTKGNT